ncbi:BON domain-containing protein [Desulfuromonas carbonis]|uniref:BON domain-containing protein n=1 Tax=Desulfuromonas sp. DDH964 TaxID=1823759 RepID=UPI00078BA5CD|nr:BON domain-containing protein [Desulfuromonas sp. DDH964]AMV73767.1 Osmotically-inducible protein Y precursor [Desulfuromonas sp. DDH964]
MFTKNRILSFLACFILAASFTGCAATAKHESTGQYVDNSVITSKVKAAIFNEPTLKSLQITVESFKGEVQLSGFVDSAASVKKAGDVARSVEGVVSVKNDLIVK